MGVTHERGGIITGNPKDAMRIGELAVIDVQMQVMTMDAIWIFFK